MARAGTRTQGSHLYHTFLVPGETNEQADTNALKIIIMRKKISKQIECLPKEKLNKVWEKQDAGMYFIVVSFLKQCSLKLHLYFDHIHYLFIHILYEYGEMVGSIYTRLPY